MFLLITFCIALLMHFMLFNLKLVKFFTLLLWNLEMLFSIKNKLTKAIYDASSNVLPYSDNGIHYKNI